MVQNILNRELAGFSLSTEHCQSLENLIKDFLKQLFLLHVPHFRHIVIYCLTSLYIGPPLCKPLFLVFFIFLAYFFLMVILEFVAMYQVLTMTGT